MTHPQIETTLVFAALFGILHVIFTLRVGGYRFRSKISLGDGGDKELRNRIRIGAAFSSKVGIVRIRPHHQEQNTRDDKQRKNAPKDALIGLGYVVNRVCDHRGYARTHPG